MNINIKDIGVIDNYIINFNKWWKHITKDNINYNFLFTNLHNKIGISCINDKFNLSFRIFIFLNSLEFYKELEFIIKRIFEQCNNKDIKFYSKYYYNKFNKKDNIYEYYINITQHFLSDNIDLDFNLTDDILINNDLSDNDLFFIDPINNKSEINLKYKKYKDPNNTPLNSDELKSNDIILNSADDKLISISEITIKQIKNNLYRSMSDNTINNHINCNINTTHSLNNSRNVSNDKLLNKCSNF